MSSTSFFLTCIIHLPNPYTPNNNNRLFISFFLTRVVRLPETHTSDNLIDEMTVHAYDRHNQFPFVVAGGDERRLLLLD